MKQKTGFRHTLQQKMIAAGMGMLIVSLAALAALFLWRFEKTYETQMESHLKDVTEIASGSVENLTSQVEQLSLFLLLDDVVQDSLRTINQKQETLSEREMEELLERIAVQVRRQIYNNPGVISVRVFSRTGQEVYVGVQNKELNSYDLEPEQLYQANGRTVWGYTSGDSHSTLGRAILDSVAMLPIGYIIVNCRNTYFRDILKTVPTPGSGMLFLVDGEGNVLTSNTSAEEQELFENNIPATKEENSVCIFNVEKNRYYAYAGTDMNNGWHLVSVVSGAAYIRGVHDSLRVLLVFAFVVFGAGAVLYVLTARRMMEPMNQLVSTMEAFAGDMSVRSTAKSSDEIEQIGETFNQMADSLQNLYERVYVLELANKEAQIEFLKMQINPHFLYNALDTISWMSFATGNEDISQMAISLAAILRASLRSPAMVTVSEEIETLRKYLYIQKIRFEDEISIRLEIDPETEECLMPGFLLQPLAENCFQHGLEQRLEDGLLTIRVTRTENFLCLYVSDNGIGMSRERLEEIRSRMENEKAGQGIGVVNVYRRLRLIYRDRMDFNINSEEGVGTEIAIRFPIEQD